MVRSGGSTGSSLMARVNFPPYVVQTVGERYVLVAGGGGSAKTGIKNIIEIYELSRSGSSCKASCVGHKDTGNEAFMNGIVFVRNDKLILAGGGFNGRCKLYELITKLAELNGHGATNGHVSQRGCYSSSSFNNSMLRRRTSSLSSERNGISEKSNGYSGIIGITNPETPQITYEISFVGEFEADRNEKVESFLKVVRYSPDLDILVTGGSDGHIRLWDMSHDVDRETQPIIDIAAHSDEIDDLDIDSSGKQIASVSRDGGAYIWEVNSGKKLFNLEFVVPSNDSSQPIKYRLRRCRFSPTKGSTILYASMLPVVMKKNSDPCYICKWDTNKRTLEARVLAGSDNLTNLTVSEDGRFIGVGTLSGAVAIYNTSSFKRSYRVENSHKSIVTGVQFLKSTPVTQITAGDNEASLVTISVDNKIIVHHVPRSDPFAFFESSLLFMVILILVYLVIDLFGL